MSLLVNTKVSCLCYSASTVRRGRPCHGRLQSLKTIPDILSLRAFIALSQFSETKIGQRDGQLIESTPSPFRHILSEPLSLMICFVTLGRSLILF
jgi:hypothetical protein